MRLLDIKCPSCGASLGAPSVNQVMVCEYCGTRFLPDEGDAPDKGVAWAAESAAASGMSMESYAAQLCEELLIEAGESSFKSAPKIMKGLNIGSDEKVFLIHDDTFMKSGKNGFAITDKGLHIRGQGEDASFLDWREFSKLGEPEDAGAGNIKCGARLVCYFTDDNEIFDLLLPMYQKLLRHAKVRFA